MTPELSFALAPDQFSRQNTISLYLSLSLVQQANNISPILFFFTGDL